MDSYALVIFIEEYRKEYAEFILYGDREKKSELNKDMDSEGISGEVTQTNTLIM